MFKQIFNNRNEITHKYLLALVIREVVLFIYYNILLLMQMY